MYGNALLKNTVTQSTVLGKGSATHMGWPPHIFHQHKVHCFIHYFMFHILTFFSTWINFMTCLGKNTSMIGHWPDMIKLILRKSNSSWRWNIKMYVYSVIYLAVIDFFQRCLNHWPRMTAFYDIRTFLGECSWQLHSCPNLCLSLHTQLTEEDIRGAAMWVMQPISPDMTREFFTPVGKHQEHKCPLVTAVTFALQKISIEEYEVPYIWAHRHNYIRHFDVHDISSHHLLLDLESFGGSTDWVSSIGTFWNANGYWLHLINTIKWKTNTMKMK